MWAFILPELLKAIEAEPENEVLAELLASLARCEICEAFTMHMGRGLPCRCIELLGAGCLGEPGMEETIKLLDKTLDQHYVRWSFKIVEVAVDAVQNLTPNFTYQANRASG